MFAARLCFAVRNGPVLKQQLSRPFHQSIVKQASQDARGTFSRQAARRRTFKEAVTAPSQGTAISVGQGALAGASVLALGGLAYYGLGLSNQLGAIDQQMAWPQYVRDRIKDTYMYFGGSILATAGSAAAIFRSPTAMRIVSQQGLLALGVSIAALIGSGVLVRSIPYQPAPSAKQAAWLLYCGVVGGVLAPLCLLGGPLLIRAAWYTAGMVGGLSTVAACAPSDKFLNWGAPLAMGFGLVFCASIGSMFLPPTTALGSGLYSVAIYGGLILFGAFLLYDTQKIVAKAQHHPTYYGAPPFDPVNASLSIYMDTVNIFIRILHILAGNKRK